MLADCSLFWGAMLTQPMLQGAFQLYPDYSLRPQLVSGATDEKAVHDHVHDQAPREVERRQAGVGERLHLHVEDVRQPGQPGQPVRATT